MDINQMTTMIEQFKQSGGDMNALSNTVQTFASTGKTALGLNQWQKSDKPTMDDFNSDNKLIDAEIRGLQAGKTDRNYVDGQLAKKVNKESPQECDLPFINDISCMPTGKSMYHKNGFGEVTVIFNIQKSGTANDLGNEMFSSLPVGFRPNKKFLFPISGLRMDGARISAYGAIQADGSLFLQFGSQNVASTAFGILTFLAQ